MLVAFLLRRGVLPFETLDELLAFQGISFKCAEEFQDLPVFVSRRSRSGLSTRTPMTDRAGNLTLQTLMRAVGIASGNGECLDDARVVADLKTKPERIRCTPCVALSPRP